MIHNNNRYKESRHSTSLFDLNTIFPFITILSTNYNNVLIRNENEVLQVKEHIEDSLERNLPVRSDEVVLKQYDKTPSNLVKSICNETTNIKESIEYYDYLFKCRMYRKQARLNEQYELLQISKSNHIVYAVSFPTNTSLNTESSCFPNIIPKKILIIDDARLNRVMLAKILTYRGHYCEEAPNGLIGLNMVKATIDMKSDDIYLRCYDVIIMDILMPVMDGIEATTEIRALGFKGPIIGVTASIFPADENDMMKAGATTVLIKPFRTQEVYNIVNL